LLRKTLLYAVKYRDLLNHLIGDQEHLHRMSNMKDEFLSVISHELRTPLTSILGYFKLMGKQCAKEKCHEQQEYMAIIMRNTDRLLFHINSLLDFTKLDRHVQHLHLQLLSARDEVLNAIKSVALDGLADYGRIALDPRCPEGELPVYADPKMLDQVLINLITNSMKYTPPTEPIRVGFRPDSRDGKSGVMLWVRDRGKGVPDNLKERIFDKFFQAEKHSTRSTSGLGLGLAIVKGIMDLHGGLAWVEDNDDHGSTFCVFFPDNNDISAVET